MIYDDVVFTSAGAKTQKKHFHLGKVVSFRCQLKKFEQYCSKLKQLVALFNLLDEHSSIEVRI